MPRLPTDAMSLTARRVAVARQPILDASLATVGYELLFRSLDPTTAAPDMTASTVVDAVAEIGLDAIVGNLPAYVNVSRGFLLAFDPLPLPADRVVLELLEDQEVDDALLDRLDALRVEGFTIALDDFRHRDEYEPLIERASIVKLDVLDLDEAELEAHVASLAPRGLVLVAEKVETHEVFERTRAMGFHRFQGYFFAKPRTLESRGLPAAQIATLSTLAALLGSQGDWEELERTISRDVGLTYKLLRWANSGLVARGRAIASIHDALAWIGERPVRQWAMLATLAAGSTGAPEELVRTGMLRARLCELLAEHEGVEARAASYTVGLLSTLDALFDAPLDELLDRLPLAPELRDALLRHTGSPGRTLERALAFEGEHPGAAGIEAEVFVRALRDVDALRTTVA